MIKQKQLRLSKMHSISKKHRKSDANKSVSKIKVMEEKLMEKLMEFVSND